MENTRHSNYFGESCEGYKETATFGSFSDRDKTSFDVIMESAYESLKCKDIDIKTDAKKLATSASVNESYKDKMLESLKAFSERPEFAGERPSMLYEMASKKWDNVYDEQYSEATQKSDFLPLKTVEYPLLVKQLLQSATKDIIQSEVTKSPLIKKQMEQMYLYAPLLNKEWKYPQCFFDGTWKEFQQAGKGLAIPSDTVVPIPQMNYDLVRSLMVSKGAQEGRDKLSLNTEIVAVSMKENESATPVRVELNRPMKIDLATGTWLGGQIKKGMGKGVNVAPVDDIVVGQYDGSTGLINLNSMAGKVVGVYFSGYLSNEMNEITTTIRYKRENFEWKIEDGTRIDAPFSYEELMDAKALLDLDLYKKTYTDINTVLGDMEDSDILRFLDDEFNKYNGFELDPLGFNSLVKIKQFNCKEDKPVGVLQAEFIESQLKFQLDRFINSLVDRVKMEDMTFVMYGNPQYIDLLGEKVKWLVKSGDNVGGIKVNYSYGVATTGNYKVQVVSTNKINANDPLHKGIRIIPYPLGKEQITFKHYTHSTKIHTSTDSSYRSAQRPGGEYTYIVGTSRYTNISVQGIQGRMDIIGTEDFMI